MPHARYDQRVRALVEVCGGPDDWVEAQRCFEEHGWPVRGFSTGGEPPRGSALDPDPEARVYEIEVRLFGAAKACDRGAAHRVRKAMRGAPLEAYVRFAEPVRRDREMFTQGGSSTMRGIAPVHRTPGGVLSRAWPCAADGTTRRVRGTAGSTQVHSPDGVRGGGAGIRPLGRRRRVLYTRRGHRAQPITGTRNSVGGGRDRL